MHRDTPKAASTLNVAVSGMRFFYQRVLHRQFYHLERNLPRPRQAKRRPKAYTVPEVQRCSELFPVIPLGMALRIETFHPTRGKTSAHGGSHQSPTVNHCTTSQQAEAELHLTIVLQRVSR